MLYFSTAIYVLFIEPFALKIREDLRINGISIPGCKESVKVSQYADDTVIFISDMFSGQVVFKTIDLFGQAAGSLLALHKCWGIWLGPWRTRGDKPFGINRTNDCRKVCGVFFGNGDTSSANWNKVLGKLSKAANIVSCRNLSLRARSNCLQVLLCSKIWYVATAITVPPEILTKFQKIVFEYFWGKIPEWVNWGTMHLDFRDGGYRVVNIKGTIQP